MRNSGQSLIELLIAMAIAAILLPAILTGFISSREGKVQQDKRLSATTHMQEVKSALRNNRGVRKDV